MKTNIPLVNPRSFLIIENDKDCQVFKGNLIRFREDMSGQRSEFDPFYSYYHDFHKGPILPSIPSKFIAEIDIEECEGKCVLDESTMSKLSLFNLKAENQELLKQISINRKELERLQTEQEVLSKKVKNDTDVFNNFVDFMDTVYSEFHPEFEEFIEYEMIKRGLK